MWYQNIRSALFSFVTIHASDGRTDRQTDGQTDRRTELRQQYRALHYMQSHGKNDDDDNNNNNTHQYRQHIRIKAIINTMSTLPPTENPIMYSTNTPTHTHTH